MDEHTDLATSIFAVLEPDPPPLAPAQRCLRCGEPNAAHPPARTCDRCQQRHNHSTGRHGLSRGLSGCTCTECLQALEEAWTIIDGRVAGKTLDDLAAPLGITRERARQISDAVAPWRPWKTAKRIRAIEAADREQARKATRTCEVCGRTLPSDRRQFCSDDHYSIRTLLRYHLADGVQRQRQRIHTARWIMATRERHSQTQVDYARRVLEGQATATRGRWIVEGGETHDAIARGIREGWPIIERLNPDIVQRVRDSDQVTTPAR